MPMILNPTREFEIIKQVRNDATFIRKEYGIFFDNPKNRYADFKKYINNIGLDLLDLSFIPPINYEVYLTIDNGLIVRYAKTYKLEVFSFQINEPPSYDSIWLERVIFLPDGDIEYRFVRTKDDTISFYTIEPATDNHPINDEFNLNLSKNYFEWTNDDLMMLRLVCP